MCDAREGEVMIDNYYPQRISDLENEVETQTASGDLWYDKCMEAIDDLNSMRDERDKLQDKLDDIENLARQIVRSC